MATTCANGINKWLNYKIPCRPLSPSWVMVASTLWPRHTLATAHAATQRWLQGIYNLYCVFVSLQDYKAYFDICTATCPNNNYSNNSSSTQAKLSSCCRGKGQGQACVGEGEAEPQALGHAQRANFSSLTGIKKAKNRRSWQHSQVVSRAGNEEQMRLKGRQNKRERGQIGADYGGELPGTLGRCGQTAANAKTNTMTKQICTMHTGQNRRRRQV